MNRATFKRLLPGVLSMLLVASLAACRSAPTKPESDLDRLQGVWEGQGPGGPCLVTIAGNALSYRQPSNDFWYETTFTLPEATGPKQLHATIVANVDGGDIGTVVVTIYELEGDKLTLGVVKDFPEPPTSPIEGDWDWVADIYHLERALAGG